MSTATLTETVLRDAQRRRTEGQSLRAIAAEVGVPWQRLEKALRHAMPRAVTVAPVSLATPSVSLVEKYRPARLDGLVGQHRVVSFLGGFARNPYPCALLFDGETGTGKTSAALALAAELGCDVSRGELGGVYVIASGEQNADAVRATWDLLWHTPMFGNGWRVAIINEADRMHAAAETIWLDRLENIPKRAVIIFTTNHPDRLSQRFRDRCVRLGFESEAESLGQAAHNLAAAVYRAELGRDARPGLLDHLVGKATDRSGKISFRRLLQAIQMELGVEVSPGTRRKIRADSEDSPKGNPHQVLG